MAFGIVFFGNNYGISVFLFIIPFIGVIIYSLSINKKIVNKKVFWLLIPIILLSSTFFVFNNSFF